MVVSRVPGGGLHRIPVNLVDRSYDIVVGHGVISELESLVPADVRRVAIVSQQGLPLADDVRARVESMERHVTRMDIERGEMAKTMQTVEKLCSHFAEMGLTRNDLVITVGGGLVSDVAGFAASIWHRGTRVIHVSTSLLGMVDAAIGGKTGVNLPQGKNLVGAFWQPIGVICDLNSLRSLPESEFRSGLGEVAKYHFLTGDDMLALDLADRIAVCARLKADIVSNDERESGRRALLNYGHTLAHALETVGGHSLAHGEAVAVGLVFAATLAHRLGRIDLERVSYHEHVVAETYGLRTRPSGSLSVDSLMTTMARDKKATAGLTFILDSPRGLEVVAEVDPDVVRATLTEFLSTVASSP